MGIFPKAPNNQQGPKRWEPRNNQTASSSNQVVIDSEWSAQQYRELHGYYITAADSPVRR